MKSEHFNYKMAMSFVDLLKLNTRIFSYNFSYFVSPEVFGVMLGTVSSEATLSLSLICIVIKLSAKKIKI